MRVHASTRRVAALCGLAVTGAVLTGCYVVPLQPPAPAVVQFPAGPLPPPAPVTFAARLYPANEQATAYGMVMAIVTNNLDGRGHFSTTINGETFAGEATRVAGNVRDGVANGAGNRGSYLQCRYSMNSATMGTGNCRLSNGATFTMHLGS